MRGFIAIVFALALCDSARAQPPDVIYYNGKIVTMWDAHPIVEAVSIRGDRFIAVGASAELLKSAGPLTKKVDLAGKSVVPGIVETHVHPIEAALSEIDGPV
ncbi:MAG: amidohydrolase, partial [Acidobacteriota bacterium]|nr:amidohydrolase [Acidobacteriota bacterium]